MSIFHALRGVFPLGKRGILSASLALSMAVATEALSAPAKKISAPKSQSQTQLQTSRALSSEAGRSLQRLFKDDWEWQMREFPEWASYVGDHRFNDRLTDISPAAVNRRQAYQQALFKRLTAVAPVGLSDEDRLSREIRLWSLERELAEDRFYSGALFADFWSELNPQGGVHLNLAQLPQVMPFEKAGDYQKYLARLNAMPAYLKQLQGYLREGAAKGWSVPRATLEPIPSQIDRALGKTLAENAWYRPFVDMPAQIPEDVRDSLRASARQVLEQRLIPAFMQLREFAAQEYPKLARSSLAASALPGGMDFYRHQIREMTTLDLSPEEVHRTGLEEVARIKGEMESIARQVGYQGAMLGFSDWAKQQPGAYYKTPEELLAAYRSIGKQADAALPALFAVLPRIPWGVRAAAPEEEGTADHYVGAPGDGSRAGYFVADVSRPETRPRWGVTSLLLHESVPGHHLQTARAAELKTLPEFRRYAWFVAYGEGWALYAEGLGEEMGLYKDPMTRYGRLTYEIFRAARLVTDTGLHAFGWTRDKAIDYMTETTGMDRASITAEVDRYIVWPGQALGYKIGELKIKALRAIAARSLGERFDLRKFHNLIIDSGPLPLAVLERRVNEWVAAGGNLPTSRADNAPKKR